MTIDESKLDFVAKMQRERDEARAEVSAAFRRGAEAMRESIVRYAHDDCGFHAMANAIERISVPEDKP